jgi:hypothetical protein
MRISGNLGAALRPKDRLQVEPVSAPGPIATALPALLPVRAATQSQAHRIRPQAALLAQLVATAENLPGARARRRADPAAVISCYTAMAALKPTIR